MKIGKAAHRSTTQRTVIPTTVLDQFGRPVARCFLEDFLLVLVALWVFLLTITSELHL